MISRAKRRAKRCIKSNCTPSREVIVVSHPLGFSRRRKFGEGGGEGGLNPPLPSPLSASSFRDAFHSAAFFTSRIQVFSMPRIPIPSFNMVQPCFCPWTKVSLGECIEKGCIAKGWLVLIYLAIIVLINLLLGRGRRKRKDLVCLLRSYVFSFKGISMEF